MKVINNKSVEVYRFSNESKFIPLNSCTNNFCYLTGKQADVEQKIIKGLPEA